MCNYIYLIVSPTCNHILLVFYVPLHVLFVIKQNIDQGIPEENAIV